MAIRNEMKLRLMTPVPLARAYEGDAGRSLAVRYESLDPEKLHADILHWLPRLPASVIDIGAGSGRDSAWFASKGYSVLAVEPSATMREEGCRRHSDPGITWLDDNLPRLSKVYRLGASFDVALLSGVWMHVPAEDRERAFCKIVNLLKPNGMIVMRLKTAPVEEGRGMHPVCAKEIDHLARNNGAVLVSKSASKDMLGRSGTKWTTLVLKFPDDRTGSLRFLRNVIQEDHKTGTHKFGLLQSVLRAADSSQGFTQVETDGSEMVTVPLGLIALNWLRLYQPLLKRNLPQLPGDRNIDGANDPGWKVLLENDKDDAFEFRPGARFCGDKAQAVHDVLNKSAFTIHRYPSKKIVNPDSGKPVMLATYHKQNDKVSEIIMDADYLRSFGEIQIPVAIWQTMTRFSTQIESLIVKGWSEKIADFAGKQNPQVNLGVLMRIMRWHQPSRDTKQAYGRVRDLMKNERVHCVWTGKRLRDADFDVDHCMPWAAWPCEDLWNLMPTHPSVNRNVIRHRLPAAETLERSYDRILDWWDRAWSEGTGSRERFLIEAKASLPMLPDQPDLHSVFAGVLDRRFSIKANQGVEEWVQ